MMMTCQTISRVIDDFLLTNKSSLTSPSLLWETLKAVIRGEIISYTARLNKMKKQNQDKLMGSIAELDKKLSISPSPELDKERQNLQMEYNLLSTQETEKQLLRSRGFLYENGEKAGRHLSHQIKSKSVSYQIKQIRTSSGDLTVIPSVINETFTTFYSELYTSPTDKTNMLSFLDRQIFLLINTSQKSEMDRPLEISEIANSIKLMQSGKAPGPDGYMATPYRVFKRIC